MLIKMENFTKKELACKCCGMFNYSTNFLINLQAFRYFINVPLIVTSGCRCLDNNRKSGGVPKSLHECETKKATAIDVYSPKMPARELFLLAAELRLFNEVIYYKNKHFVHLGIDPNQKSVFFETK